MNPVVATTHRDLQNLAVTANHDLEHASAIEVMRWAGQTFGRGLVVTASMQDAVLPYLTREAAPQADVLFLDTGYHFAETIGTRDAVEQVYGVNIINARARLSVAEQDAEYGPRLHERNPDLCCAMRKTAPLNDALANYDAWVTGVRRVDAPTRANTQVIEYDARRDMVKISPMAAWSDSDYDGFIDEHDVIVNPLLRHGYPSIGCEPCTRAVAPGEDARAGRWAGQGKTECGIHL